MLLVHAFSPHLIAALNRAPYVISFVAHDWEIGAAWRFLGMVGKSIELTYHTARGELSVFS
jgi:hypothetical protein